MTAGAPMTAADWAALQAASAEPGGAAYLSSLNNQNGMSAADWQSLQAAMNQPGGAAYLSSLQQQQAGLLAGIPGVGGGSAPGAPGTSTSTTVGQDAINAVQAAYPDLAWLLTIPDIAPLIVQAAQTGMDEPSFLAEFQATTWYKTHSDSVRTWITLVNQDPAQALANLQAQEASMQGTLEQLGLQATQSQIMMLSQASLAQGWTDQQIKDQIAQATVVNADGTFTFNFGGINSTSGKGTSPGGYGALTSLQQSLAALSKQFLINVSPQTIDEWVQNSLTSGQTAAQTEQAFQSYLQDTAISQFPWMQQGIAAGQTPLSLVAPYATMVSNELGVNQNTIDWTQPKWGKLLSAPDPTTGTPTQNPIWKATQQLRQDPQYGWSKTPSAIQAAYSFVAGMQETMGQRSYAGQTPGSIAMPASFGSQGG